MIKVYLVNKSIQMKINNKNDIINSIKEKSTKEYLKKSWIKHISLFWSFARWEETANSDIDLLYENEKTSTFSLFDLADLQYYFEKLFWKKVDLVSKNYINDRIKEFILSEKIDII